MCIFGSTFLQHVSAEIEWEQERGIVVDNANTDVQIWLFYKKTVQDTIPCTTTELPTMVSFGVVVLLQTGTSKCAKSNKKSYQNIDQNNAINKRWPSLVVRYSP